MATQIDLRFIAGPTEYLVRVDPSLTVAALKCEQLAPRFQAPAEALELSAGGAQWDDAQPVGAYAPVAFSVVHVLVKPPPPFIDADEAGRTAIVQGVPAADPAATEAALLAAFSEHGSIVRMLFQDDGSGAQRAVLVYDDEDAAEAAADAGAEGGGVLVLGARVAVSLAAALPPAAAGAAAAAGSSAAQQHVAAVGHLLAAGYLSGRRGLATVLRYGEQRGLGAPLREAWESARASVSALDARFGVGRSAQAAVSHAVAAATSVDRELRLSERGAGLVSSAVGAGKAVLNDHPAVARVVHSGFSLLGQALAATNAAVQHARSEVLGHLGAGSNLPAAAPHAHAGGGGGGAHGGAEAPAPVAPVVVAAAGEAAGAAAGGDAATAEGRPGDHGLII